MNAGKRGISGDLSSPRGVALIARLAGRADVVIENFRPGVLDRAGLGYATLSIENPGLIMLSISGFGATGPESQRQAYRADNPRRVRASFPPSHARRTPGD